MYMKQEEFALWLREVKGVDREQLSRFEEKRYFEDFMEDYNTATLPKKFYNLQKWEADQAAKSGGSTSSKKRSRSGFNDEEERMQELKRQKEEQQKAELQSAYASLNPEKVQAMREQERLKSLMQHHYRMGNTAEALKIQARIMPPEGTK
eukprot:GILI01020213.1.p2 GENE.GILI01020213.1~~GILI01020213.1.p2  ORF type:complete len:150 (-),score=69.04 GILI01020213.1:269-718(-)